MNRHHRNLRDHQPPEPGAPKILTPADTEDARKEAIRYGNGALAMAEDGRYDLAEEFARKASKLYFQASFHNEGTTWSDMATAYHEHYVNGLRGKAVGQCAPKTLVIDRLRWARGARRNTRLLSKEDGTMCCLGFLALACGIPADDILGESEPADVESKAWPKWLVVSSQESVLATSTCANLIEANDAADLSESERETEIAGLMSAHGVDVTFVDGEGGTK